MEDPGSWNLLTACLAVFDLKRGEDAWAFLTALDLVEDSSDARAQFLEIVRAEIEQGPITGPSMAFRVSLALKDAGLTRPRAEEPDGNARTASRLRERFDEGEAIVP